MPIDRYSEPNELHATLKLIIENYHVSDEDHGMEVSVNEQIGIWLNRLSILWLGIKIIRYD